MISKRIIAVFFLIALIAGTAFILSRSHYRTSEGRIFGTTYRVKYAATQDLDQEILEELLKIDAALSIFNDTSTISRFNRNEPYQPNELFTEVVRLSLDVAKQTDGAFDITVAPLVNAWGFGFKHRDQVTQSLVDSLLTFVGYQRLSLEEKELTKQDSRITIDGGAVAKGYAVDRVAKLLSKKGCTNYMVEVGGEVVLKGKNPDGRLWSLGINTPIEDSTNNNASLQAILQLTNKAIATSGNYRNFYYNNGRKYAHTLSPITGYPVEHSLLSATVIAPSCAKADAIATALMVMGTDKAKAFADKQKDIDIYLIFADDNGNLHTWQSQGMQKYLQK